jgi:hypothetical protein
LNAESFIVSDVISTGEEVPFVIIRILSAVCPGSTPLKLKVLGPTLKLLVGSFMCLHTRFAVESNTVLAIAEPTAPLGEVPGDCPAHKLHTFIKKRSPDVRVTRSIPFRPLRAVSPAFGWHSHSCPPIAVFALA